MSVRKIIITGPECSGKSTLAAELARRLKAKLVPEISRSLLLLTGNQYKVEDLALMASYQKIMEDAMQVLDDRYLVCDTSGLEYKVWLSFRFGKSDPFIDQYAAQSDPLFILCSPLKHWEPDILRVNQHDRQVLFDIYAEELRRAGQNHLILPDTSVENRILSIFEHIFKD